MFKVAINQETKETRLILIENEKIIGTSLNDKEILVSSDGYLGLIKPLFKNGKWIEGATEEEVKAWQEENKIIKQPTTEEKMLKEIANLKIDNMKKDTIINNTLKTVSELKVKVMSMEGGN